MPDGLIVPSPNETLGRDEAASGRQHVNAHAHHRRLAGKVPGKLGVIGHVVSEEDFIREQHRPDRRAHSVERIAEDVHVTRRKLMRVADDLCSPPHHLPRCLCLEGQGPRVSGAHERPEPAQCDTVVGRRGIEGKSVPADRGFHFPGCGPRVVGTRPREHEKRGLQRTDDTHALVAPDQRRAVDGLRLRQALGHPADTRRMVPAERLVLSV